MNTNDFGNDLVFGGLLWRDVHEIGAWKEDDFCLPDLHAPGPPRAPR